MVHGRPTFRPINFGPSGFRPTSFCPTFFRPTLDLSDLLSSKTYNRPFSFCPILVQPNLTVWMKLVWIKIGHKRKPNGRK